VMASPDEAGVLPALCLALLAGVAVGASLLDLPRRRLGLWQPLVLGGLSLSLALFLAGLLPALWSGGWEPGRDLEGLGPDVVAGVTAVLEPEAASEGRFRALWVGEGWFGPRPAGVAGPDHTLSGPSGPLIDDLYPDGSGPGAARLQSTIAAVEQSATDRGGRLLGAFNIRYVVVARAALREGWLRQRDLGVVRSEPEYLLLENGASLPRAGVLRELPPGAGLGRSPLETAAAVDAEANLTPQGRARFGGEGIQGPGVVWLAENPSPGWSATLGGRKLSAVEEVWGNAFRLPPGSKGELEVTHLRPLGHLVWFGAAAVGWLAAFGAATARKGSEPVLESGRVRGGRGWRKAERG
jgi:hypothetical protein